MKKTILLGLSALFSLTSYAQLSVDSVGNTHTNKMKTTNLEVTGSELGSGRLLLNGTASINYSDINGNNYSSLSITQHGQHSNSDNYITGIDMSLHEYGSSTKAMGIRSVCYGGSMSYGIFAGNGSSPASSLGRAGIYASSTPYWTYMSGCFAGYFYGDVKSTGTIYGTLVSPSSVSSPSGGGTTTNLSAQATRGGETVTEKLQQVDLLQMERVNQDGSLAANKVVERGTYVNEEGKEVEAEEPIQTKLSAVSYGLAADQLQEVYPELVYEDADGNYSINYVEMVPLLVQSIRELSAKVTALEAQLGISDPSKPVLKTKGKTEDADNVTLTLPDNGQEATLNVYDLSGKLLRTSTVNAASAPDLSSYTRGLPTGTYAYSLTMDGKKQKARKVVVR